MYTFQEFMKERSRLNVKFVDLSAPRSSQIKKDKRKVKSVKKVMESTKAKKSNEAKEAMKEIEAKKNKNVAEPKDIPFSWIRKILEDKKTLKAGRDKQAT